ncbi:MAG: acyl dehydratase [Solirubrobacterales bacterium]|jgi:acyl dehydratase|nr:acyl dehydratase [Solirubrobacterales bacterium]
MSTLFFEDFTAGRVFDLGERTLTEDDILTFARDWDPQAFHVDPAADAAVVFGGVIASGWQTVCVWMRMYVDEVLSRAAMLAAPGVEEIRWLAPVRPGMVLRGRTTIVEAYVQDPAKGRGTLRLRGELVAEDGSPVMTMLARGHARLREHEEVLAG